MKKKREKRFWNKSKWQRKDQFDYSWMGMIDKWYEMKPIKYDWKDVRSKDRQNFSKIRKGYDPDDLIWVTKFQYFRDYF